MKTAPPSLARRYVKWRLAKKHSKSSVALNVALAAAMFALAYWDTREPFDNILVGCGVGFLFAALSEWEIVGFSELYREQQRLIDEATAANPPPSAPAIEPCA